MLNMLKSFISVIFFIYALYFIYYIYIYISCYEDKNVAHSQIGITRIRNYFLKHLAFFFLYPGSFCSGDGIFWAFLRQLG